MKRAVRLLCLAALGLTLVRSGPVASDIQSVNAGPDQFVTTPARTTLQGIVTANGAITSEWTVVSVPAGGVVQFGTPTALQTTVFFAGGGGGAANVPGAYTLRLTAHQSGQPDKSDDVVITLRTRTDFNSDGKVDISWQDQTNGNLSVWYMDKAAKSGGVVTAPSSALPLQWKLAGIGDFDYDGKSDFLWEQYATGAIVVWYMDGVNRKVAPATPYASLTTVTDLNWTISGVGDFNADGRDDIVWQHADGRVGLWYMNGTQSTPASFLYDPAITDLDWRVVGVADFNGDGHADLLFQHQTGGQIVIWYMNGVTRTSVVPTNPAAVVTTWKIVGVGDFGKGDPSDTTGAPDILWRNYDGTLLVWFMNGVVRSGYVLVPPTPTLNWTPSGRYTIPFGILGTPSFSPAPGTYTGDLWVSMSNQYGGTIRYTRGDTTPADPDETSLIYSNGIPVLRNTVLKARAYRPGWTTSTVSAPASYAVAVATPVITPGSGAYARGQTIRVECGTPGAVLHYSTDGSTPTELHPAISPGGTLLLDRAMTLKVGAWSQNRAPSGVATAAFTFAGGPDRGTALFVVGNLNMGADDAAVKARLESLGFTVNVIAGTDTELGAAATGKALIVVSATISNATVVGPAIRSKAVPIVTWEWNLYPEMYLTGTTASDFGMFSEGFVSVASGAHPLAAKRSGNVIPVYGANSSMGWGKPTASAAQVGTIYNGAPTNWGIFGYEEGAALFGSGGAAPARRVGLFGAGSNLTLDGWAFFDAAVNWAIQPPLRALYVYSSADSMDTTLKARLQTLGFATTAKTHDVVTASDASGKALVVISSSVTSYILGSTFRDVTTPVVSLEFAGWRYMEMTGSQGDVDYGAVLGASTVAMVNTSHSLAAGLSGTITTDSSSAGTSHPVVSWGVPGGSALKIATQTGQPSRWSLFAYEKGSALLNGSAQGRRVGLTPVTTTDGLKLFDAAVRWAVGYDTDGDGLSDATEARLGTNPNDADTNDDGINDGAAIAMGISATNLDMDGDGVGNALEIQRGTDPFRADTDGDGVSDLVDVFPLDPTRWALGPNLPGHPVITLTEPTNASLVNSTCTPSPCQ